MLDDAELKQEIEFNRIQLGMRIPNRIEELLLSIDNARDCLEEWYSSLFIKIGNSILRVTNDLFLTIGQDAFPASAWNARSLLELWMWTKYCSISTQNARRFHEDAARDMLGLVEAHASMCKLAGIQNPSEISARKLLAKLAQKELGVSKIDPAYARVADAAKQIGLAEQFRAWNVHLSKFAHPTAGLVIGIMHQTETLPSIQSSCTTMGLYYAGQCVISLEGVVSKIPA